NRSPNGKATTATTNNKRIKKRSLFDSFSFRSRQQYSIKMSRKSGSQTKLLDNEGESENMLFSVDSIGSGGSSARPVDSGSGDQLPLQTDDQNESVVLTNGPNNPSIVIVHYNKRQCNDEL